MTDQQHPLIPPPELVQQWIEPSGYKVIPEWLHELLQTAAQWGADQELDACCERLTLTHGQWELAADLRAARRPRPSSLALEELIKQVKELDRRAEKAEANYQHALVRLQQLEEQQ